MVTDAEIERKQKPTEYNYKALAKAKMCVAPLKSTVPEGKESRVSEATNFYAIGKDECCEAVTADGVPTICNCAGDVVSGMIDDDLTGDFRL